MQLKHSSPLTELRALFRTRPAFRRVFMADVLSGLGDGSLLIAFPMVILDRTHDMTLSGVAFSGEILAFGLMSPIAGYWADRLEQKRTMMAANVARIVLMGLVWLSFSLALPLACFFLLTLVLGASAAFFVPARSAYLRRLVEPDELQRVVALENTTGFLLRLVAPPLMGVLLAFFPPTVGLAADMLAYGLSFALLAPRWVTGSIVQAAHTGSSDWREGWRFIMTHDELRGLLTLDVVFGMVGTAAFSLTIALLGAELHLPPQANAALLATTGLAGAVGTQLANRLGRQRWTMAVLVGMVALTYLLVPTATSLVALMTMWVGRGLAIGAFCVLLGQRIAAEVPSAVMGRVQAAWGLAACLAAATGSALSPLLLRTLGPVASYTLFGGVLTLVALVLAALAAQDRASFNESELVEAR